MVSVKDQLQSVSGELLIARLAFDSDWADILNNRDRPMATQYLRAAQLLAASQQSLEQARNLLEEL